MTTSSINTTATVGDSSTVVLSSQAVADMAKVSPFAFPRATDDTVRNANIVIVDDEASVAQLVNKYLRDAGFENTQTLTEPAEALTTIESLLPDLVLLDLRMQPVNGLEILETMRRNERTEHTPVIVLTSDIKEAVKITALNLGANDFLTKPVCASELGARVRNTLCAKAYRDMVTDYSVKLESDVLQDSLTGVANRRAFEYEIKRRISEWNRQRTHLGLLMIDLDYFKRVNDLYGHRVGDAALAAVANVLTTATREMDLIARYGGEEFAILLPMTTTADSQAAAERVRRAMDEYVFSFEGHEIKLTVSVGVASAMRGDDANLLVQRADTALYTAKQQGRNCTFFHDGASCLALTESTGSVAARDCRERQDDVLDRPVEEAKIVVVDDEVCTVAVVKKYLSDAGFQNILDITEARLALETIRREEPDVVLLDIRMPEVSGLEILRDLRNGDVASQVPVLIFTSSTDKATKVAALDLGASDFLEKPVDVSELLSRVRNTLLAKSHLDNLSSYSNRLEHEVRLRTTELAASRREAIHCLARAAELRDDQTGKHVLRVGRYAAIVAEELGFSEERVVWMEHAAQLHDVGKIGVPDSILKKPGKLTADEWRTMKAHCLAGTRILLEESEHGADESESSDLEVSVFDSSNSPIMRLASVVAQTHHEKWDGSGYPQGLAGTDIPIEGRIAAVADVFDALSTKRPYKEAIPLDRCFKMIEESRGSHFDPDILDAFFRRKSDIVRTYHDYADVP